MKRWIGLWLAALLALSGCGAGTTRTPVDSPAAQEAVENVDAALETELSEEAEPETTEEEPEAQEPKTVLRLGGLTIPDSTDSIKFFVNRFNEQSSRYFVELVDYKETGENWEQGVTKLNTELMADSGPDMLFFNPMNPMLDEDQNRLSPLPYIARGFLMDMTDLLEADPELDSSDILIWDALNEFGGLYLLTPEFYIDTIQCSKETYETYAPWTIETYLRIEDSLEEGQMMMYTMNPRMFLMEVCGRYIRSAIDLTEATCDFDNAEFIALLRAATEIGSYDSVKTDHENLVAQDGSFKQSSLRIAEGELIGCWTTPWSAADIAFDRVTGGEAEPAYIGRPTADGSSGSDVVPVTAVGICANTDQAEGCWEFVRYLLTHPNLNGPHYSTPAYRPLLDDSLQKQQVLNSKLNPNEADLEIMIRLSESCQNMGYYDQSILNIILEEGDAMVAGGITPEIAAKTIQNRASLYVMEQYG